MFKKLLGKHNKVNKKVFDQSEKLVEEQIPKHIAIIMDGNGRWAKQRSMPRIAGHHEGMKTVRRVTRCANQLGVKILTLYAFSTENWKRPKKEVDFLMGLPEQFLKSFLPELMDLNIRVQMIGEFEELPTHTQKALQQAMDTTANNTGLILNFAMNYGSRAEIVKAIQSLTHDVLEGRLTVEEINDEAIDKRLMTMHLSDPDLLIRTSGEVRLSNFMLWQLAYTEFLFVDALWPDFDEQCLIAAVEEYQKRNRRYGGLKGEDEI